MVEIMEENKREKKELDFEDFEGIDPEQIGQKSKYKVLIIDDDKMIQSVIGKYLQSWGFQSLKTADPYDAVALAVKHRPLFIFLDVYLPELNGEKLLKLLKKIELTSKIPVIIISGNLSMDLLNSTFRDGATGFLSKPFTKEDLYESIGNVLSPAAFHNMVKNGAVFFDDDFDENK